MATLAARRSGSESLSQHRQSQRRHSPMYILFKEAHARVEYRGIHKINVPERTRGRALTEVTLVERVAELSSRRSLSFSEYADHYEPPATGTRISGSVRDAAPTALDWEIGS